MPLALLFAGTPDVAVPALRLLAQDPEHFDIRAVLTRPDAPTGRGRKLVPSPVKQAALALGLPVIESDPNDEQAFIEQLHQTGAEIAAVVAYGKILRQPVLDALPLGWYNLHFSLLPQWRGAAPVQRAIWAGDDITGVSVFRITRGMDAGPILAQYTTAIADRETSGELLTRLAEDGAPLLASALCAISSGEIVPVEQQDVPAEIAHKITLEDAHIRFDVPVFAIDRQIRACTPKPGAFCKLHANSQAEPLTLQVLRAIPAHGKDVSQYGNPHMPAGSIIVSKHQVWVTTASEPLELLEVKVQGKKAMKAADWARGAHLSSEAYCD